MKILFSYAAEIPPIACQKTLFVPIVILPFIIDKIPKEVMDIKLLNQF